MARSKLNLDEVNRAQIGPRDLKDPRSKEYAIQTVYALKTYVQMKHADEERVNRELAEIRKYRHWEILGYVSEDELLTSEVGMDRAAIIERARNAKPLAKHGEVGRGRNRVGDTKSSNGTTADYLTARIARDHPKVLDRMKRGEFKSVRAAAIEAGIVKVPSPLDLLMKAWKKANKKHREAFLQWAVKQ